MHDSGVTPGYWRAVSHNLNAVALECFIDECASAAGKDPIEYRLSHDRHGHDEAQVVGPVRRRVGGSAHQDARSKMVRDKSGWGKPLAKGKGRGVAVMEGYNTVIAMVAEVTVSPNYDVAMDRVVAVVDAGPLVHPDQAWPRCSPASTSVSRRACGVRSRSRTT